jgi:hypothetical protein
LNFVEIHAISSLMDGLIETEHSMEQTVLLWKLPKMGLRFGIGCLLLFSVS